MADIEIGPVRDSDTGEVVDEDPTDDEDQRDSSNPADVDSDTGGGGSGGGSSDDGIEVVDREVTNPDRLPDFREEEYEDSGGSSGGGGAPEPGDDGTKNIIVTGGPGTGEPQKVVGEGDTLEEARADAAANPDFRAADDTEIREIQERIGNVPREGKASVTVTGGPGTGEPQRVVGRGDTRFQSDLEAARNTRFDAEEGTRVDFLESQMDRGQGNETGFEEAYPYQTNRPQPSQERVDQARQDRLNAETRENLQNLREQDVQTFDVNRTAGPTQNRNAPQDENAVTGFMDFVENYNEENFQEDMSEMNPVAQVGEGVRRTGLFIIDQGGKTAEDAGEFVEEQVSGVTEAFTEPRVVTETGQEIDPSEAQEDIYQGETAESIEETGKNIASDAGFVTEATAQGPSQFVGIAAGGVGGGTRILGEIGGSAGREARVEFEEEGVAGIPGGAAEGFTSEIGEESEDFVQASQLVGSELGEEITGSPGKFVAEEALEEVGQGAAGRLLGPAGVIVGAGSLGGSVTTEVQAEIGASPNTRFADARFESDTSTLEQEAEQVGSEDVPVMGQRDPGAQGAAREPSAVREPRSPENRMVPQETDTRGGQPVNEEGLTQNELEVLAGREVGFSDVSPETQTETGGFEQKQANILRQDRTPESEVEQGITGRVEDFLDSDQLGSFPGQLVPPETEVETGAPDADPELSQRQSVESGDASDLEAFESRGGAGTTTGQQSGPGTETEEVVNVPATGVDDEDAFRREEMAIFGSPLEDTDELSRQPVSERLTEPARVRQPETGVETDTEELTGIQNQVQQPEPGFEDVPPGLQAVNDPAAVTTRTPADELAAFQEQESQAVSPEQSLSTGLESPVEEEAPQDIRPLDENALAPTRGETPAFREDFVHEEQQQPQMEIQPEMQAEQASEARPEPEMAPEIFPEQEPEPQRQLQPEIFPEPEPQPETQPDNSGAGFNPFSETEDEFFGGGEETPTAAPDVTSLLFGGGEENVGSPGNPATGLERRAPSEENEEDEGLFGPTGLF